MGMHKRSIALAACVTLLLSVGCISLSAVAPGVSVIETRTGKTLSHIRDASLDVEGPWGPHDAETLLPCELADSTFQTIYTVPEGWCVREFDGEGRRVSTHILPPVVSMHSPTEQYAIFPGYERIVFCDSETGDIRLYDAKGEATRVLVERAVENPFSIEQMTRIGQDSVVVEFSFVAKSPYKGSLVLIPLDGGPPRILHKYLAARGEMLSPDGLALSPDSARVAVRIWSRSAGSRLIIVNLADGSEEEVGAFSRPIYVSNMAWSPDGKTLAYSRDMSIEVYSRADKQRRVLKENPPYEDGMTLGIEFLDNDRLAYCYDKSDYGRTWLEILDVKTGQTLVKRSLRWSSGLWYAFDNGNRIAMGGK